MLCGKLHWIGWSKGGGREKDIPGVQVGGAEAYRRKGDKERRGESYKSVIEPICFACYTYC